MPRSRLQYRLFDLVMWVILAALVLAFVHELRQIPRQNDSFNGTIILIGLGFGLWFAVRKTIRGKRTGPVCQECGRRFSPHAAPTDPPLCARCRARSLPRAQGRREQVIAWLSLIFVMTVVISLILLPTWDALIGKYGSFAWILLPLEALGASLGFLTALFVVAFVVLTIRNMSLCFEKPALALARKSARCEGTLARDGPLTIWWSGPTDPVPLLMEQMGTSRQRFEHLIDEPVATPPLRVLVFDERRAFVAYHRNVVADRGLYDCLYACRPVRSMTISTEAPHFRLVDQTRSTRAGFVLYFIEAYKGFQPAPWLQSGISGALAYEADGPAREQLNRRMKVALANGTALGAAEFFARVPVLKLREQLGPLVEHTRFARLLQFRGQARSVVEYLAGFDAPLDRLGRFRSFFADVKARGSDEEVFAKHFGHGFDVLLAQWKEWVEQQIPGCDPIPPPEIRSAIIEKLVPAVVDRSKKAQDRIEAMRAMGGAGYVLGAHALIDVLREGDERFIPTAAWALEGVSGQAWGNDAERWAEWWSARDPSAVAEVELG